MWRTNVDEDKSSMGFSLSSLAINNGNVRAILGFQHNVLTAKVNVSIAGAGVSAIGDQNCVTGNSSIDSGLNGGLICRNVDCGGLGRRNSQNEKSNE